MHPFTGVICCLLLVSWASAVEDDERKLSENDNREKEYFDFYIQESTHSGKYSEFMFEISSFD